MISQSRYVRIVSGVGAGAGVAQRQLIMRLMTQSSVLPPGVIAEFANADAVGSFFGTNTEEYRRAQAYFSFINKSIQSPQAVSFARWVSSAIAPMIVGDAVPKQLSSFAGINAGTLRLLIGAATVNLAAINLSAATDLGNVASLLQTAIRANADPQLANASVLYNTNTGQFTLTGSVAGSGSIKAASTGGAQDLGPLLGWSTAGAVNVAGQAADTAPDAVRKSADVSNNFGSFVFVNPAVPLTNENIEDIAAWNHSQNNMYMYSVATTLANLPALYDLVKGYSGCALNIKSDNVSDDFIEQSPCEILASTDYTRVNSTQNFMFYQFANRTVTVSDDTTADLADASRGNYIGVTQSAGQQLAFFQRGILCGGSQDAVDMNTYSNEMWLKSALSARILELFLNVPNVPANPVGAAMILGVIQSVIDRAKNNGTISAGKTLSEVQRQYVNRISGDATAWRQVETIGFWIDITFESYVNTNTQLTEWKAKYILLYSKDDAIRMVEGSDVMI